MQTLANKSLKEERLPVLLGNATDIKLVGVAKYNTGNDLASEEIIASNVQTTEGYLSLVCQGKYMPNALKGNAEK